MTKNIANPAFGAASGEQAGATGKEEQGMSRRNERPRRNAIHPAMAAILLVAGLWLIGGPEAARAQSPIMLGGRCILSDVMPDNACGCAVPNAIDQGVRPAEIDAIIAGRRAQVPANQQASFDRVTRACIADPEYGVIGEQLARERNRTPLPPGEPLRKGLPSGMGSPWHMCTRTLSIVGEQCGCMANRVRDAGIADAVAVRLFGNDGSSATAAQASRFNQIVRGCSRYPMDVKAGVAGSGQRASVPVAARAPAPAAPIPAAPPIPAGRHAVDPRLRVQFADAYRIKGLRPASAAEYAPLRASMDCGTSSPICAERHAFTPADFGVSMVDLNEDGVDEALLLPLRGGRACTRGGCYWGVITRSGNGWSLLTEFFGFGNYLAIAGLHNGHAVLAETPDRSRARYWQYGPNGGTYTQIEGKPPQSTPPRAADRTTTPPQAGAQVPIPLTLERPTGNDRYQRIFYFTPDQTRAMLAALEGTTWRRTFSSVDSGDGETATYQFLPGRIVIERGSRHTIRHRAIVYDEPGYSPRDYESIPAKPDGIFGGYSGSLRVKPYLVLTDERNSQNGFWLGYWGGNKAYLGYAYRSDQLYQIDEMVLIAGNPKPFDPKTVAVSPTPVVVASSRPLAERIDTFTTYPAILGEQGGCDVTYFRPTTAINSPRQLAAIKGKIPLPIYLATNMMSATREVAAIKFDGRDILLEWTGPDKTWRGNGISIRYQPGSDSYSPGNYGVGYGAGQLIMEANGETAQIRVLSMNVC